LKDKENIFRPAVFGIALICFFLPFLHISCEGIRVATFSEAQLVLGTTIQIPEGFGGKETVRLNGEPLAILTCLSVIVGLALSFSNAIKTYIAAGIMGIVGTILLLLLKVKLDNDIIREGEGMLLSEYGMGYWLTFIILLSAAGYNFFSSNKKKRNRRMKI